MVYFTLRKGVYSGVLIKMTFELGKKCLFAISTDEGVFHRYKGVFHTNEAASGALLGIRMRP